MRTSRRTFPAVLGAALLALGAASPAAAQRVAFQRVPPLRAKLEQDIHRARFTLGPLRLLPILRLSDVGYTNNVLGTETDTRSDWTASVSAGFGFVLPLGHDVFLHGEEAPTYNWFAHLVERRNFGGRYGANLAVFLNRLTVDAGGGFSRTTNIYSTEQLQPIRQQETDGHVNLELFIFERLGLVASGEAVRWRARADLETDQGFRTLDNDTVAGRAGIRYRFRGRLDVTAEVERTRQTFQFEGDLRDNETTGYLLGLGYDRPRLFINALAGYREGRPYNGSAFPTYRGLTGSAYLTWSPARRLDLNFGGSRNLVNSLFGDNPYYAETMGHAGFDVRVGYRLSVGAFGELSKLKYPIPVPLGEGELLRVDDGWTVGASLGLLIFRNAGMNVRVSRTHFTSNYPGADRNVTIITSTFSLDAFLPYPLRDTP